MKRSNKFKASALVLTLVMAMTACGGGGTETQTTAGTTVMTNELEALDTTVDWNKKSEIDEIDEKHEEGTGKLYESGKKAGVIKALCYYNLADTQPDLAELLAERYGGTIETDVCSQGSAYFDRLATLVSGGSSPDIVRYDWMVFPWGVSKNLFTPLDDWLDMDSPLWSDEKEIIEDFSYAGKHYYYPSLITTNFAIMYNRLAVEEAGLDDPMDYYKDNNWTWDTFEALMREWVQQGDDYIGFTGGSWTAMMFANTTGTKIIDMADTEIVNNIRSQNVQRTMDWLGNLKKNMLIGEGFIDPGQAFLDGKLLFLGMGLTWGFESAENVMFQKGIENEMVALPFPRDPDADKYYISADSAGFVVPSGATNIQGAVDWILCGRTYETDPEIIAANKAKKMDTSPMFYAKCPSCKHDFTANGEDALTVCPECNTARKQKFKPYYSQEQLDIIDDMVNPEKFSLVFDNTVGFGDDFSVLFIQSEDSIFDGPLYYGTSFTQLRESKYGAVESFLEPYRESLAEALEKTAE